MKRAAITLVVTHLIVSTIHGLAHRGAMITLAPLGYVYVVIVITVAPLIAGALLLSRKQKMGALLLTFSMAGSFAFGVWYHFLSAGSDNVAEVRGDWHATFLWTALALAVIEFAGAFLGWRLYREIPRTHAHFRP